jgi:transposase
VPNVRKIKIGDLKQLPIAELVDIILEQSAGIDLLMQQIQQQQGRIAELELLIAKLTKDSSNSSKPPSSDFHPPASHTRNSRTPSGKKPGGQPGHRGITRMSVDIPDEIITVAPVICSGCGADLNDKQNHTTITVVSTAQAIDIPPIIPIVTEYQKIAITCTCGHRSEGQYPSFITPGGGIQLGSNISSFLVYMNTAQHIPYGRLQTIASDLLNMSVSEGTIKNKLTQAAAAAMPVQRSILSFLHRSPWVGSDETGAQVEGERWWQWVWQNTLASYYAISPSRGYQVIKQHFGEAYEGTIIHDCLSTQNKTTAGGHQLCHAHLFRDYQFLIETKGENALWAYKMKQLLYKSQRARDHCHVAGTDTKLREFIIQDYRKQLVTLLSWNLSGKESRKLQKRLIKHQNKLLHFMNSPDMPPDNNGSERAIRNAKVKQKVSGGFRSEAGATRHATLLSIIETAKKQDLNVLSIIQQLVRGEEVEMFGAE